MAVREALGEVAASTTRLLKELKDNTPPGGSLTVVGTGIRAITQLTLESLAVMANAEVLLHVGHVDVLAADQEANHERGVDHFAEPLLLDDVRLQSEDVGGFDAVVEQLRHTVIR